MIIKSSFKRQNPDWKASTIFAMGRSNDERWSEQVLRMLISENNRIRLAAVQASGDDVIGAAIWSLSQIGGEDVRLYLQNLLDNVEDNEQAIFLEEALDNLTFTEDMAIFDLLAVDADEPDAIDLEE